MPSINSYSITLTLDKVYSEKLYESFQALKASFPNLTLFDPKDYHVTIGLSRDEFFNLEKQESITYEIQNAIFRQDFSSFIDVFTDQLFTMKNPNSYYNFSYLVLRLTQLSSLKPNIINNLNQEIANIFQANDLEVANFSFPENYIAHISIGKIENNLNLNPHMLENFLTTLKEKNLVIPKFFSLEVNFTDKYLNQDCFLNVELEPLIYHDQVKTYKSQFNYYHQNSHKMAPPPYDQYYTPAPYHQYYQMAPPYEQYHQMQLYPQYSYIPPYHQEHFQDPVSFRHPQMSHLEPEYNPLASKIKSKKFNIKDLKTSKSSYQLSESNDEAALNSPESPKLSDTDTQSNSESPKLSDTDTRGSAESPKLNDEDTQSNPESPKLNNTNTQNNSALFRFTPREKMVIQDLILMEVLSSQEELSTNQEQALSKILHYFIQKNYETTTKTDLSIERMHAAFQSKHEYLKMLIDIVSNIEDLYNNHNQKIPSIISVLLKIYTKTKHFQQDFMVKEENGSLIFTTKDNDYDKSLYLQNITELNALLNNLISKQAMITLRGLSKEILDFFNSEQNKNERLRNFTISSLRIKTEEKNGKVKFILVPFGDLIKYLKKAGYVLNEVLDQRDISKDYLISFPENLSAEYTNFKRTNKQKKPLSSKKK